MTDRMIDQLIDTAWDEYRGWAKRARELQSRSQNWSRIALACWAAAAVLGAAAVQAGSVPYVGAALALAAAVMAAVSPLIGKEILSMGSEARWIRARATAEAIKSECYRLAARADDYAGEDAASKFFKRLEGLTKDAVSAQIAPLPDPVGSKGDRRRPSAPLDLESYKADRIKDQITYFSDRQRQHEQAAERLRWLSFGASGVAAVFGVLAASYQLLLAQRMPAAEFVEHVGIVHGNIADHDVGQIFAAWIAALTTIAASVAAYGLLERRQYLAASFSAMATSLGRLRNVAGNVKPTDLVTQVEDLLQSEHLAWTERMTQTIPAPPTTPTAAGATQPASRRQEASAGNE
jgi:hypothetical protein